MSFNFPYPGPIPPYTNFPIEPENFQPRLFDIADISFGQTTTVTTTTNQDYVLGQSCRLIIPKAFGAQQLNGAQGIVIQIPASNQVVLNIVSQGMDAFIPSPVF